jgi:hypothetical protein
MTLTRTILGSVLLLCGCKSPDPEWAVPRPGLKGEATIGGDPLKVPRLAAPPVLDGKLDDAAWADAAILGPLVSPRDGQIIEKSPVAAFARLGWDDQNLYLGVVVHDGKPTSPFGRTDVDPHVWGKSSGIELLLQPGDPGDNRDYYEFQVDVNGAVFDSHFDDYNAPLTGTGDARTFGHQDFTFNATRAIYVHRGSFWSVEAALPWTAITGARSAVPPKPGDVWRLNLYSFRDGQRLALAWSPLRGQGNFHKSARFGRVQFTDRAARTAP